MTPKPFKIMFCGLRNQKWKVLEEMVPVTSGVKANTAFCNKNKISTVKHGGGNMMLWGCFATSGPGLLAKTDTP